MRRTCCRLLVALVAFSALAVVGCGKSDGDKAKKKAAFDPGKLVAFENKEIGFSMLKPEAVAVSVNGDTAELKASGFPTVTVTLHKTKVISSGSSSSSGMGEYTRKVYAPMRKLVCHSEDVGEQAALVKKICASLKNAKDAPKKLSVKFDSPEITGKLKNKDAFTGALAKLQPKIIDCWKKAVAADAKFPQGNINVQITYKPDGSRKQWGLTRSFNYKADMPLANCVEKLVMPVKPEPDGGEVKLGWEMRFKLY